MYTCTREYNLYLLYGIFVGYCCFCICFMVNMFIISLSRHIQNIVVFNLIKVYKATISIIWYILVLSIIFLFVGVGSWQSNHYTLNQYAVNVGSTITTTGYVALIQYSVSHPSRQWQTSQCQSSLEKPFLYGLSEPVLKCSFLSYTWERLLTNHGYMQRCANLLASLSLKT